MPHSNTEVPTPCAVGGGGGSGTAGSRVCTVKIRFALGKNTPRINCARLAAGGYVGVADAVRAVLAGRGAGHPIRLVVASAAGSSFPPAGNPLLLRMCATRSTACSAVSCAVAAGGAGGGIE